MQIVLTFGLFASVKIEVNEFVNKSRRSSRHLHLY